MSEDPRRACEGKRRYMTRRAAHEVARRMRRQFPGQHFEHYQCGFCSCWHVGHPPRKVRQAKMAAIRAWREGHPTPMEVDRC